MRLDAHVHLWHHEKIDHLLDITAASGSDQIGIVCIPEPKCVNMNPAAWVAKARHPQKVFVFGALDHSQFWSGGKLKGPSLAEQVDIMKAIGCDGIKMLENKPATRKQLDIPVDSDYFAAYFARVEQARMPILWHVADPEEFWDPKIAPKWALERGWVYDSSYVRKEQLYSEVENVLARHPKLTVIFAHFYFLSADLKRAAALFDRFPGVHLDLAPGIELLYNMSKNVPAARAFFIKYADRIVYGTDIASEMTRPEAVHRAGIITRWLESSQEYRLTADADFLLGPPEDGIMRGLELPADVVQKICRGNYERLIGRTPKPLDKKLARQESDRIARAAAALNNQPVSETEAGRSAACLV
ncbi:MAG TPA: amidohydrolase family protein [Planctomycetota bacterium]|jgi:predicted TIM-barrel fold metal-dependent hydrolase